ncbi:MAG TPA: CRISPR-associated endonuclease Cas2 [Chromatiales bacterium]|nr:CRISPR-associated endonuclease Cas2 [Chromatiales bacterium]
MTAPVLYVAAYDIADERRRRRLLRALRAFALDGQKSAYECPLDPAGRQALLEVVGPILDREQDRFVLLRVEGHAPVRRLGNKARRSPGLGEGLLAIT